HPSAAFAIMRALCRLFRYTNRRQIDLSALDVLGRVAAQLSDLASRFGTPDDDDGIRITLPITHDQLASAVATSREAVGKAMQRLTRLGLIEYQRRQVTVLDLDQLLEYAQ